MSWLCFSALVRPKLLNKGKPFIGFTGELSKRESSFEILSASVTGSINGEGACQSLFSTGLPWLFNRLLNPSFVMVEVLPKNLA